MEGAPRPPGPLGGPAAWTGADLARRPQEWTVALEPDDVRELEAAARAVRGVPLAEVSAHDVPLPSLAPRLVELRRELLHGRGFAVLRGLPVAGREECDVAAAFWALGAHLGAAVSQNARGDVLGHVRDEGRDASDPTARLYQTRERQGWHTDSADLVALLCLRPARSGGRSSLVSCVTLHDVLLERCPDLLARLFEPFGTDHRGEEPPGAAPWFTAPILSWFAGELSVLYQRKYIESAQRFEGVSRLGARGVAALDALDGAADDPALHLSFELGGGDVLVLHNHQMLHDRTGFEDWPEVERRRHLLRLWLCPAEGRALPGCFAERYGGVEVGRRGGVRVRRQLGSGF